MSTEQIYLVIILSLTLLCGVLAYVAIRAVNEIMWLREDVQTARDVEHAKCAAATMAFVGDEFAAQVLEIAASDYESVENEADLARIRRLVYRPEGPPIPSIWLRERADRLRIMVAESREEVPALSAEDAARLRAYDEAAGHVKGMNFNEVKF